MSFCKNMILSELAAIAERELGRKRAMQDDVHQIARKCLRGFSKKSIAEVMADFNTKLKAVKR